MGEARGALVVVLVTTWQGEAQQEWKGCGKRLVADDSPCREIINRSGPVETFWVDLSIRNPLDVDVSLSALTVGVREAASPPEFSDTLDFIKVEVVDDIQLGAKETRTVSCAIDLRPINTQHPSPDSGRDYLL